MQRSPASRHWKSLSESAYIFPSQDEGRLSLAEEATANAVHWKSTSVAAGIGFALLDFAPRSAVPPVQIRDREPTAMTARTYRTFREFYAFYLSEHSNRSTRRLHFLGTSLVLVFLIAGAAMRLGWLIPAGIVQAYALAWIGHLFFEKNKPATFSRPWFSFLGDWRMWFEMLTGKIRF